MCEVHWWKSGYDERIHAFAAEQSSGTFAEAVCEHSVPVGKITRAAEGSHCMPCQLIVGTRLADLHGDPSWRL